MNPSETLDAPHHRRAVCWKTGLILAAICLVSAGGYLLFSRLTYRIGFPLDDAWIHQTYARNLALRGEWAFIPGKPSGGSTAPLWSALLAIGFWLRLGPLPWAYLLGTAALWGLSVLSERTALNLVPMYSPRFPWVGTAIALEWHLAWAAVSGMETLLYAFLATLVLCLLISGSRKYFGLGLLAGLTVWVRPDGITLLGPIALVLMLSQSNWKSRMRALLFMLLGFGSLFSLYLLFNLTVSGSPLPNTFYAKQAEYAILMEKPFFSRLVGELLQPLIGVGIILLLGFLISAFGAIQKRNWGVVAAVLWLVGFLGLYAWRLPVTYQHGRYVIPGMPIFFLLGLAGIVHIGLHATGQQRRLTILFTNIVVGILLVLFWVRGAAGYSQDVAFIESEMVDSARWTAVNLPLTARVAAHDIGALGYYGNHDLVDLAGLVSPEVIPFLRDETKLASYLSAQHVNYLITFPDWYPKLVSGLKPIYSTGGIYSPEAGGTNMSVYQWSP